MSEDQKKLAQLSLASYNFPVEMMVVRNDGHVIAHENANEFLHADEGDNFSPFHGSPLDMKYLKFLEGSLAKANSE